MSEKTNTNAMASHLHLMKSAIIEAHNGNNVHAINEEEAARHEITSQSFVQWKRYVENLRQILMPYVQLTMDKTATKAVITKAQGRVYAEWKDVLTDAMGKKFSKNWFVRESDTAWLLRAVVRNVNTKNGASYGFRTPAEFRREVERLIGCRIASNAILTDVEADTIKKYEAAKSTKARLVQALDTGDDKNASLREQLKKAEETRAKKEAEFKESDAIMAIPDLLVQLMASYDKEVTDLETQVAQAEKGVKSAEETMNKLGKTYKEIMAKVKKIEE